MNIIKIYLKEVLNMMYKNLYKTALFQQFDRLDSFYSCFYIEIYKTSYNKQIETLINNGLSKIKAINACKDLRYISNELSRTITMWFVEVDHIIEAITNVLEIAGYNVAETLKYRE